MKRLLFLCLCALSLLPMQARRVTYTQADSALVVKLLRQGMSQPAGTNMVLYFARQFMDVPYVAATLEVNSTEQLVVNLHQLDCTTYVETVLALTLTAQRGLATFDAYCDQLSQLRYRDGVMNGYPSRNHYFSQWIDSNQRLGLVREITGTQPPFTARQTIDLHYMSQHPDKYPMLRDNVRDQAVIRANELKVNGRVVHYIPKSALRGTRRSALGCIHDGDVLALVTRKDGLDVSHLGFAVWGQDGRLHLLNASMLYKKVVLDSNTLYQYQQKQTSQTGIRVIRLTAAPH